MRVVPNRYPALTPAGTTERHDAGALEMDAVGAHEVVIETRRHDERLEDMEVDRIASLVKLWRERSRELAAQSWARAVVVFRNFGERGGTSLDHPHSQIIATPVTPPELFHRIEVAERYWEEHGRSVYRDMLDRELERGERMVAVRDDFVALAPFASHFPFETWIMPREAQASFTALGDGQLASMATVLRDVLRALRDAAGDPDYNLAIRSAPVGDERRRSFVWHLAVFPRTTTQAGFELGAGMAINTVLPEGAAAALRASLATAAR
jgi:UDPglucose--hexose-1-phosphate uridylyltransferase